MNEDLEFMTFISLLRTVALCTTFLITINVGEPSLLSAVIQLVSNLTK